MQHTLSKLLGALDISRVLEPTYVCCGIGQSIHGVTLTSSFTSCKENYALHQRYSDSDWGGDSDERKITSGNCFMVGKIVCLCSFKKQ